MMRGIKVPTFLAILRGLMRDLDAFLKSHLGQRNAPRSSDVGAREEVSAPKFSIIIPSFNQAAFIERTLLSVINQNYPSMEIIVIDGGSTDGTLDVIKRYESDIAYWVSEPDRGQAAALNKGLRVARGELIGWQNSDDVYFPGALSRVAEIADSQSYAVLYSGVVASIDASDHVLGVSKFIRPTRRRLLHEGFILSSQGVFWRRESGLWFDETQSHAMDYELWLRLLLTESAAFVPAILGAFRSHEGTKTDLWGAKGTQEVRRIQASVGFDPTSKRAAATRMFLRLTRIAQWYAWTSFRVARNLRSPAPGS
jgi:hypothetical protein